MNDGWIPISNRSYLYIGMADRGQLLVINGGASARRERTQGDLEAY